MLKFFCISAVTHAYLMPSPRRRSRAVVAATDSEQWDSFTTHHVGEWFGAKTVYDSSGKVVDEDSVAITCLKRDGGEVTHVLKVPAAALAASGCDRCADTIEWWDIPAGSYKEGALGRFTVNGQGAAVGPSLLRSGGVSFELAIADGERRCTLTASFAPESDKTLALRRCVLSRERSDAFPDDDAAFHSAVEAYDWSDEGLAVDAPGGISFCVAERIKEGAPAPVSLRWNALAADAALTAFPGPPVLASFDASS